MYDITENVFQEKRSRLIFRSINAEEKKLCRIDYREVGSQSEIIS